METKNIPLSEYLDIDLPYFICDDKLNITFISENINRFNNIKEKPAIGNNLCEMLEINSSIFDAIISDLSFNLPIYSTKFDKLLYNSSFLLLPFLQNNQLKNIICILLDMKGYEYSSVLSIVNDRSTTPIFSILNSVEIMSHKFQQEEDYITLSALNSISKSCYNILYTNFQTKLYFKLINNKYKQNLENIVLNEFIEKLVLNLKVILNNKKNNIELNLPSYPIIIDVDEHLLSIAIFNIIKNAIIYSPDESKITISISSTDKNANIIISDEGDGIIASKIDKIFNEFYSVQDKNTIPEENIPLGLGLPIAKKIVELSGGNILVSSISNQGSIFSISIPTSKNDTTFTLNSSTQNYTADKFSDLRIIFSDICDFSDY